ncbi:MAG: hypothetical protein K2M39_07185 [Muribaculaceae bacterium]|nr:hypothetical protein [Muribaculaceae bacterium]
MYIHTLRPDTRVSGQGMRGNTQSARHQAAFSFLTNSEGCEVSDCQEER